MSKLNPGEIAIILEDEERILKPTLRALSAISGRFNGLARARQALVDQDLDATVFIIRHGLNMTDREAKNLPQVVFENGLTEELVIPLIKYTAILANGGKPLPDQPEDESTEGNE